MRYWLTAPLLFAMLAAFSASFECSAALAQDKEKPVPPEEETFMTADGVQLHALFHKSAKTPGTDPVVVMIYPPGKDNSMTKGDWIGLANRLSKEGYNVYRFDWRGHGKSIEIKDTAKFWGNVYTGEWNKRLIKGAKPNKDSISVKEIVDLKAYLPVFVTDLAAVRAQLDIKNDAGELNTSSIYLIGSETAAALGMAWLAAEWNRPAFAPTPNQLVFNPKYEYIPQPIRGDFDTGGADVSGAVWLSASPASSITQQLIKSYVTGIFPSGNRLPLAPKIRDNNSMLFMYGPGDATGKQNASFFHNQALAAKGNGLRPLNDKYLMPVKSGGNLVGVNLLGNNEERDVEKNITEFLAAIQTGRKQITRKPRGYNGPYFVKLSDFGLFLSNNQ